jgi:hypothetical protein
MSTITDIPKFFNMQERHSHYQQLLEEASRHLEIPFDQLATNEQPINKEKLTYLIKDVATARASVTETLLQETLDGMKDKLEYQHMRATVVAEFENAEKTTRRKSGASSCKISKKK